MTAPRETRQSGGSLLRPFECIFALSMQIFSPLQLFGSAADMQLFAQPKGEDLTVAAADASMRSAQLAAALLGPFDAADHEVQRIPLALSSCS